MDHGRDLKPGENSATLTRASGYKLVQLANGARSVHSLAHDETFHPVVGPVEEAEALYVRQLRVAERLRESGGEFVIWDVGLGAAGNAVALLRAAKAIPRPLRIVSFDQTLQALRFALGHEFELPYLSEYREALGAIASGATEPVQFTNGLAPAHWETHLGDFPTLIQSPVCLEWPKPHVILFDAYSPATNPAMWTAPLFNRLFELLDPSQPCALPTYSRSTMLRVTLLLAGFYVGRGHPVGEKDQTTIAANTSELIEEPLDARWLRRARNSTSAEPLTESVYRQAPLSEATWVRLRKHPQFSELADSSSDMMNRPTARA